VAAKVTSVEQHFEGVLAIYRARLAARRPPFVR